MQVKLSLKKGNLNIKIKMSYLRRKYYQQLFELTK